MSTSDEKNGVLSTALSRTQQKSSHSKSGQARLLQMPRKTNPHSTGFLLGRGRVRFARAELPYNFGGSDVLIKGR